MRGGANSGMHLAGSWLAVGAAWINALAVARVEPQDQTLQPSGRAPFLRYFALAHPLVHFF